MNMIGWLANCLQIVGLVLLGKRHRIGWLFGIAAEVLWIVRANEMRMYDLTFISVVYIFIATASWHKWRNSHHNDR